MRSSLSAALPRGARAAALALLPMLGALAGALVDERARLGVTVWRSACRASGFALRSVSIFTLELLPCAVIGALAGGVLVLVMAFTRGTARVHDSLAAHAGCVFAMPVGLVLCALAWPLPLMLAAEAMLAGSVALLVLRALAREEIRSIPDAIRGEPNGNPRPGLQRCAPWTS